MHPHEPSREECLVIVSTMNDLPGYQESVAYGTAVRVSPVPA